MEEQNRSTLQGLFKFDKRFPAKIQKFHQLTKYSTNSVNFSLLRFQILEFAPYHLFHCLVGGREQTHQGRQNVDQLGQVFENISLLVVLERLLATG